MVHQMACEKQEAVNLVCSYKIPVENKETAGSWYLEEKQITKIVDVLCVCIF